jgi:hypothetical protein
MPVHPMVGAPLLRTIWLGAAVAINAQKGRSMRNIIYVIGLIVVIIAVLSFFGLR